MANLHIVFLFFAGVMFSISLMSLFGYHCFLVSRNRSTLGMTVICCTDNNVCYTLYGLLLLLLMLSDLYVAFIIVIMKIFNVYFCCHF